MSQFRRRLMQVKHPPNQIVATYNVTSTTSATKLCYIYLQSSANEMEFDAIYIDGEKVNLSKVSNYYQYTFPTLGEHEAIFVVKKDKPRQGQLLFNKVTQLVSVDFENFRSGFVYNMGQMFDGCTSLVEVKNMQVAGVTSLTSMFYNCSSLQSIDLSKWDVSSVISFSQMFYGCTSLQSIDLSKWDMSSAVGVSECFTKVSASLDVSEIKIGKTLNAFFKGYLGSEIIGLGSWDTSSVTNMSYMFSECTKLQSIDGLENWDTSSVTTMAYMFNKNSLITSLAVDGWDVSGVEDMSYMFNEIPKISSLNLSSWDVRSVKKLINFLYLTSSDLGLLTDFDISKWSLELCEDMSTAFRYRNFKLSIPQNFGKNCKNFGSTFAYCGSNLISNLDLTKFDMSSAERVSFMFNSVVGRSDWDLSSWNLSKVIFWEGMFYKCASMSNIWFNTEINPSAALFKYNVTSYGLFNDIHGSSSSGIGTSSTIIHYFPYASFVEMFLPITPIKWQKESLYTPSECVSLTIDAENVNGQTTSAVINWSALTNGYDFDGNYLEGIVLGGKVNSEEFGENSGSNIILRELTYTYMDKTATTIIKQYPISADIVATYNVTSTTSATNLLVSYFSASNVNKFDYFKIDGVIVEPTKTYIFSTTGEHIVEMFVKKTTTFTDIADMFYNTPLRKADLRWLNMQNVINHPSGSSGTDGMFENCRQLTEIVLPYSITYIGVSMFYGCYNVTSFTILRKLAPYVDGGGFGSPGWYLGYNNRKNGTNKFYVRPGSIGYDEGEWKDTLQSPSYCGFTKEEIEIS